MTGPSRHLSWAELRCKDGTEYPADWRSTRAVLLAQSFEALRAKVGQPLVILSGYRSPEHNKAVGGARLSQHVEGRALDLRPPPGWTVNKLAEVARSIPSIMGIGYYPAGNFLHIDVRPSLRVIAWHGSRPAAEVRRA